MYAVGYRYCYSTMLEGFLRSRLAQHEKVPIYSQIRLACRSTIVKKVPTGKRDALPEFGQSSTTNVRVSIQTELEEELGVT